jgi:hypothetical protein
MAARIDLAAVLNETGSEPLEDATTSYRCAFTYRVLLLLLVHACACNSVSVSLNAALTGAEVSFRLKLVLVLVHMIKRHHNQK